MFRNWRRKNSQIILFSIIIGIVLNNQLIISNSDDEIPITSNEDFFTVAVDFFDINLETYRLVIGGEVYNPLNLSLDEIKTNFTVTSEIVRLTCIAYKFGETSTTGVANWTGVKLSEILDWAQINLDTAYDVVFHTPDLSSGGYSTSLTLDEAYWDDVILAYEMNGEPLPLLHGFPLRLVCPRFYGYKWIKWIASIDVITEDYLGYWESGGFYEDSPYVDESLQIYYPHTARINSNRSV
ncbi:unnamed protein product [marine sediment metagenome]|uniref:Oxidoreductase molybdopterin-binding domain-containing protein n=1 Tax=marine sediment metagenome TaxID=412755 RepID=X1FNV2_9ZZZZ